MANDMESALDMLKELLSDPNASDKISSVLSTLQKDDSEDGGLDLSPIAGLFGDGEQKHKAGGINDNTNKPDAGAGLPELPIGGIMKMAQEYQKLNGADDDRVRLLKALRPYLRPHRISNLDNAVKMLSLAKLAPLLGNLKDIL